MIGFVVNVENRVNRIQAATDKAAFRNFRHAAASIRKTAQRSIRPAPKEQRTRARRSKGVIIRRAKHRASRPGSPVHTQRGQVRGAINYHADETGAIIGPRYSVVADSMVAHEFGGSFRGATYPERPTMGPALEEGVGRFADDWEGSIGE